MAKVTPPEPPPPAHVRACLGARAPARIRAREEVPNDWNKGNWQMNASRRLSRGEHEAIQSVVDGVDEIARQQEAKWGVGRLELLVSDEMREKFRRQLRRFNEAINEHDVHRVQQTGAAMKRGWEALNKAAEESNAKPIDPDVWEIQLSDGRVVALCRTNAEAFDVYRSGRCVDVWTVEEIARLIEKFPEIALAKQTFPGAIVQSARSKLASEAMFDSFSDGHEVLDQESVCEEVI